MTGIGKWSAKINVLFMKLEGIVEIREHDGQYTFDFTPPERFKDVTFRYFDVYAEGDTIHGKGEASAFPGKIFEVEATFHGDTMSGRIILPFMGNKEIEIKDGHKIGD